MTSSISRCSLRDQTSTSDENGSGYEVDFGRGPVQLSRSPKVLLQNRFQPEFLREDAGRMAGLPVRDAFQVFDEVVEVVVDGRILQVCTDCVFGLSPEFIHRVEFGRSFGYLTVTIAEFSMRLNAAARQLDRGFKQAPVIPTESSSKPSPATQTTTSTRSTLAKAKAPHSFIEHRMDARALHF